MYYSGGEHLRSVGISSRGRFQIVGDKKSTVDPSLRLFAPTEVFVEIRYRVNRANPKRDTVANVSPWRDAVTASPPSAKTARNQTGSFAIWELDKIGRRVQSVVQWHQLEPELLAIKREVAATPATETELVWRGLCTKYEGSWTVEKPDETSDEPWYEEFRHLRPRRSNVKRRTRRLADILAEPLPALPKKPIR